MKKGYILLVLCMLNFVSFSQETIQYKPYIFIKVGAYTLMHNAPPTIIDSISTSSYGYKVVSYFFNELNNDSILREKIFAETQFTAKNGEEGLQKSKAPSISCETKNVKYVIDKDIKNFLYRLDSVYRTQEKEFKFDSICIKVISQSQQDTLDNYAQFISPWTNFKNELNKNTVNDFPIINIDNLKRFPVKDTLPLGAKNCIVIFGNDKPYLTGLGYDSEGKFNDIITNNSSKVCVVCAFSVGLDFKMYYGSWSNEINLSELKYIEIKDSKQIEQIIKELGY